MEIILKFIHRHDRTGLLDHVHNILGTLIPLAVGKFLVLRRMIDGKTVLLDICNKHIGRDAVFNDVFDLLLRKILADEIPACLVPERITCKGI